MSQVRGTISVDVAFTDSTTVGGVQSLKTITLRDAQEYTAATDKVVILQGTAGTAQLSFGLLGLTNYRNAAGNLVTLSGVNRIVFAWDAGIGPPFTNDGLTASRNLLFYGGGDEIAQGNEQFSLRSFNNIPAMSAANNFLGTPILAPSNRTGSYTIIIYSAA